MVVQAKVTTISITAEAAAEEAAEDLLGREAKPASIEQGCEQVLDVLLVNLFP